MNTPNDNPQPPRPEPTQCPVCDVKLIIVQKTHCVKCGAQTPIATIFPGAGQSPSTGGEEKRSEFQVGAVYLDNLSGGLFIPTGNEPDAQKDIPVLNFDGSTGWMDWVIPQTVECRAGNLELYYALRLSKQLEPAPPITLPASPATGSSTPETDERNRELESDSIVASCNCHTKTNEHAFHKKGCKYRLICERDQATALLAEVQKELTTTTQNLVYADEKIAELQKFIQDNLSVAQARAQALETALRHAREILTQARPRVTQEGSKEDWLDCAIIEHMTKIDTLLNPNQPRE